MILCKDIHNLYKQSLQKKRGNSKYGQFLMLLAKTSKNSNDIEYTKLPEENTSTTFTVVTSEWQSMFNVMQYNSISTYLYF